MKRLILAVSLLVTPALADPAPHTIDMTVVLTDLHGKAIPDSSQITADDPKCEKCGPLTLGTVVATSLLTDRREDQGISTVEKAKRGALAMRVIDDKAAVLTSAQVDQIVKLMSIWPPLISARAMPLVDPNVDLTGAK